MADEVRPLANRPSKATDEIVNVVQQKQQLVDQAIASITCGIPPDSLARE